MLYTLMPFVCVCHDRGMGDWWCSRERAGLWSVRIISIQHHRLGRLLVELAAGAWMETRGVMSLEGPSTRWPGRVAQDVVVDVFEFEES